MDHLQPTSANPPYRVNPMPPKPTLVEAKAPAPTMVEVQPPMPSYYNPCNEQPPKMFRQHDCKAVADMGAIMIRAPSHPLAQTILGIDSAGGVWA